MHFKSNYSLHVTSLSASLKLQHLFVLSEENRYLKSDFDNHITVLLQHLCHQLQQSHLTLLVAVMQSILSLCRYLLYKYTQLLLRFSDIQIAVKLVASHYGFWWETFFGIWRFIRFWYNYVLWWTVTFRPGCMCIWFCWYSVKIEAYKNNACITIVFTIACICFWNMFEFQAIPPVNKIY